MYLLWRKEKTAKDAKKNTSPNVLHLQYFGMQHNYVNIQGDNVACRFWHK